MTALVLCGGGSRGAVEVGLYRAVVELGISIDLVVGTSVGAINGAAIASGVPPDALARFWKSLRRRDLFALNRQLFWKLIWADSLYDSRPLRRFLERYLPVSRFEELKIPLVITGTDFQTGQPLYWREGPLLDAIMASIAMPGLFPPQVVRGAQVVDGGITDNVPIDVAVANGADTVIFMLCACCEQTSQPVHGLLPILRRALGIAIERKYHADIQRYAGQASLIALEPQIALEIDLLDFSHTGRADRAGVRVCIGSSEGVGGLAHKGRKRWVTSREEKERCLSRSGMRGSEIARTKSFWSGSERVTKPALKRL